MCIRPLTIVNPKYKTLSGKAQYRADFIRGHTLPEDYYISVPCGKCSDCIKSRSSQWRVRLYYEYKLNDYNSYFLTLTLNGKSVEVATKYPARYIRKFLESARYHYKHSPKHWFVTELCPTSGRLHYHGILFLPKSETLDIELLNSLWPYGYTWIGYCNNRTISYVTKYVTKFEGAFRPSVYASPGLGKKYVDSFASFHRQGTEDDYFLPINGFNYALPRYYKLKIFDSRTLRDHSKNVTPSLKYHSLVFKDIHLKNEFFADILRRDKELGIYPVLDSLVSFRKTISNEFKNSSFDSYPET